MSTGTTRSSLTSRVPGLIVTGRGSRGAGTAAAAVTAVATCALISDGPRSTTSAASGGTAHARGSTRSTVTTGLTVSTIPGRDPTIRSSPAHSAAAAATAIACLATGTAVTTGTTRTAVPADTARLARRIRSGGIAGGATATITAGTTCSTNAVTSVFPTAAQPRESTGTRSTPGAANTTGLAGLTERGRSRRIRTSPA